MRVEVLGGLERRRRWSQDDKARIVEETLAPGAKVTKVARRNEVAASLIFTWRRQARTPNVSDDVRLAVQHALEKAGVEFIPENGAGAGVRPAERTSSMGARRAACLFTIRSELFPVRCRGETASELRGGGRASAELAALRLGKCFFSPLET
jgi:hypothetical protein